MGVACVAIASPRALAWLASSRPARLLHGSRRCVSLADDRGDLLSLVWGRNGLGPFAAVVEGPPSFGQPIGTIDRLGAGRLRLGEVELDASGAAAWSPRPDWSAIGPQLGWLTPRLTRLASLAVPPTGLPFDPVVVSRELAAALSMGFTPQVLALVTGLAGLGPGLTPAGDDLLLGVVLACIATASAGDRRLAAVVDAAARRTTTLSAAWLRAAADGEVAAHWHPLVGGIVATDEQQMVGAARGLLEVGVTSGRVALLAFVSATEVLLDRR